LKDYLPSTTFSDSHAKEATPVQTLFGEQRAAILRIVPHETIASKRLASLERKCELKSSQLQKEGKAVITFPEYKVLREALVGNGNATPVAARDLDQEILPDEFELEFERLRGNGTEAEPA